MLRILILITCMFLFPDIYGVSIFQFCGRYEYNCYYYDGKLYMNLAKIPCHELVITQVDISNNCLDGYLYDFEGEKRLYHIDIVTENPFRPFVNRGCRYPKTSFRRIRIDIVTEKLPYIYNRGQRISFSSLHQGDEVMIYTNWQTTETGYAGGHCNGFNLSWVKQIELLKCPHIT